MLDVLTENYDLRVHGNTPLAIDMQKLFFAYTMDSISKIFFDRDASTMRNVKDELAESFDKAHRYLMQYLFKNVVVGFARRPTTAVRACIAYFFITTQRHMLCGILVKHHMK